MTDIEGVRDVRLRCENGAVKRCRRNATKSIRHHVVDGCEAEIPTDSKALCDSCFERFAAEAMELIHQIKAGERTAKCAGDKGRCKQFFHRLSSVILEIENL